MKKDSPYVPAFWKTIDIIMFSRRSISERGKNTARLFNGLRNSSYSLYTGFPHKLWKTLSGRGLIKTGIFIFCATLLFSCTFFNGAKKEQLPAADAKKTGQATKSTDAVKAKEVPKEKQTRVALDSSLIDKNEEEVKDKFGEPNIVSKTPDNQIIWTYKPKWKIWPDNADTVYVEFADGKVARIVRAVR